MWRASSVSGYPTLRDDWFHLEPQGNKILQLNNKNLCGGHRQAVKTMDCGSIMRGFESHCPPHLYKKRPFNKVFFVAQLWSEVFTIKDCLNYRGQKV